MQAITATINILFIVVSFITFFHLPAQLAKKGSFTQFDLDDVDVDGSQFSFNAYKKRISFTKTLWLTEGLRYEMRLSGTYQVVEMSRSKLVLQKEAWGVRTVYSFHRYK